MMTSSQLSSVRRRHLQEIFGDAPAGEIPVGRGRGQALIAPGTPVARTVAAMVRLLAWKGKEFDGPSNRLRNLITPFAVRAIAADVYLDASRIDGRPCVVLDYSKTSLIARWVRDEIREVAPGLYLGVVFIGSRRAPLMFSLEFGSDKV